MMNEIITGLACCGIIFIVVSVVWVLAIMQGPKKSGARKESVYEETDRRYADAFLQQNLSYDEKNR